MDNQKIANIRHSLAHLLAYSVVKLHPNAKPTLGPAIEDGFYYDFYLPKGEKITNEDLIKIKEEMEKTLPSWHEFRKTVVSEKEAKEIFKDNPFKLELIDGIIEKGEEITLYESGSAEKNTLFIDLCKGGHSNDLAKEVKDDSWKLTQIAGAYWRGDEKKPMLTRIYGLAFSDKKELLDYEEKLVEAEKRDHRKIGKEMDIFDFNEDVGAGLPLWLPNGGAIIEELEKLAKETEFNYEYDRVHTPHLAKDKLYLTSGHLPYYEESMFPPMEYEGGKYYLKAMNCPHHHKIFDSRPRTYKDLPLRLAEYGTCYRHEKSGELFGLMRVRSLQMNDAHIYCTEEQFFDEFKKVIEMYLYYFKIFGIKEYKMRLSKHSKEKLGKKYIDNEPLWVKTEEMVRKTLVDLNVPFFEAEDEGAFYGPKIDVQIWSAIGREFTLATNQVDFAVPERFGLTYIDRDGVKKTPLCIHRAPLSTHERFIGFLIEHYAGKFPTWLHPVQIYVIPVKESAFQSAENIYKDLRKKGIRAKIDLSNDGFGKKVRKAKDQNIPYSIIIGDKDIADGVVTLESRDKGSLGQMKAGDVINKIEEEINKRT